MSPEPSPSAPAALAAVLDRLASLQGERAANPILDGALATLADWQSRRLAQTYADLALEARYADAVRYFEADLYGNADFAQRDADLARVAPMMVRLLPERVIATVVEALELHALSQELDRALLMRLPRADGVVRVIDYCRAYRRMHDRAGRERQIALVVSIGRALDRQVRKPLLSSALRMMRRPAEAAGLAALHGFLDRGLRAFRRMDGAQNLLDAIAERETGLMQRIFDGDDAPFPEPPRPQRSAR